MSKRRKTTQLNPSLSKAISAILLIVTSLIIILSFFGKAGEAGDVINQFLLGPLFGNMRYAVPFVLLLLLWFGIREKEQEYRETYGIGLFLFFLSACSLFHFKFSPAEMKLQALQGNGGGILGMPAWLLQIYLGNIASIVLLIGLLIVSLLLTFNTSITQFILAHKKLTSKLGSFGDSLHTVTQDLFVKEGIDDAYDNDESLEDYREFQQETQPEREQPSFSSKTIDKDEEKESSAPTTTTDTKESEPEIETSSTEEIDIDQPD
ncbi:MAG: hypothetical protein BRC22_00355, partial [Parcubacteria group bacterium QH_9_35_7]